MSSIAVQTAVGEAGSQALTELSFGFSSMLNLPSGQIGCNGEGIHILNEGNTDSGVPISRTFTLATSDFNSRLHKTARFLYIGVEASDSFVVSVKFEGGIWRDYTVEPPTSGLQRVRVPIGSDGQGRYVTIKVTSENWFRVDTVDMYLFEHSSGMVGY